MSDGGCNVGAIVLGLLSDSLGATVVGGCFRFPVISVIAVLKIIDQNFLIYFGENMPKGETMYVDYCCFHRVATHLLLLLLAFSNCSN